MSRQLFCRTAQLPIAAIVLLIPHSPQSLAERLDGATANLPSFLLQRFLTAGVGAVRPIKQWHALLPMCSGRVTLENAAVGDMVQLGTSLLANPHPMAPGTLTMVNVT